MPQRSCNGCATERQCSSHHAWHRVGGGVSFQLDVENPSLVYFGSADLAALV